MAFDSLFSNLRKTATPHAVKRLLSAAEKEAGEPLVINAVRGLFLARLGQLDEAVDAVRPAVEAARKKDVKLHELTDLHPRSGRFAWHETGAKAFKGKAGKFSKDLVFLAEYFCTAPRPVDAATRARDVLGLDQAIVHACLGTGLEKKKPLEALEQFELARTKAESTRDYRLYIEASAMAASLCAATKNEKGALKVVTEAADVARRWPGNFENHGLINFDGRLKNAKPLAPLLKKPAFQAALARD
ncbi:MAG: hypothetical protein QM817_32215 [Archangium sp.]